MPDDSQIATAETPPTFVEIDRKRLRDIARLAKSANAPQVGYLSTQARGMSERDSLRAQLAMAEEALFNATRDAGQIINLLYPYIPEAFPDD